MEQRKDGTSLTEGLKFKGSPIKVIESLDELQLGTKAKTRLWTYSSILSIFFHHVNFDLYNILEW